MTVPSHAGSRFDADLVSVWFFAQYRFWLVTCLFRDLNGVIVTKLAWTSTNVLLVQLLVETIRFVPVCTVVHFECIPTMLTPLVLRYKGGKYESVHSSSCINIQECVNLEGAYNCVCRQGYEKQIPKGIDDPEIILGSDLGIESKNQLGTVMEIVTESYSHMKISNKGIRSLYYFSFNLGL